jgi:hypothetical protein
MKNYYEYKYSRYGYGHIYNRYEYSEYSLRSSCTIDIESQTKKLQKRKEMEANIPKRALMLEKLFDNDLPYLPHLPYELWFIVAEYEGGVESSLLGNDDNNVQDHNICSWCNIL